MKAPWKLIQKKTAYEDLPWNVIEDWTYELPNGNQHTFSIQIRRDIVVVFAITADQHVFLIEEFYPALHTFGFGLIGGTVDVGHTPLEIAKKELHEEVGAIAEEYISLGIVQTSKYSTHHTHFFLALGAVQVGEQTLEDSEDIEIQLTPLLECKELLNTGKITQQYSQLCMYKAFAYLDTL